MSDRFLNFERIGEAGVLTFTAPQRLNALNSAALEELDAELIRIEAEELSAIRGLILTGEGKAFIAGADIAEMEGMSSEQAAAFSLKGQAVMNRISALPIPVIAAVNGFALGGGLETAVACDFIFASEKARMGLPETTLGIIPGYSGSRRLADRIGRAAAKELIFTGRFIHAGDALRLGLVNRICPPESLLEDARALVTEIGRTSPTAIAKAKNMLKRCGEDTPEALDGVERDLFGALFDHPDQKEGMRAFLAKEKPEWRTL